MLSLLIFSNRTLHPRTKASRTERLEKTLTRLRERVDSVLTVAELARGADLAVTHFIRLFRKIRGTPPAGYRKAKLDCHSGRA